MSRARIVLFGALCVVCIAVGVGYVALRALGQRPPAPAVEAANPGSVDPVLAAPHLVFIDTTDPFHKRLGVASLSAPESDRYRTSVVCDRVYFAGQKGLCSGSEEHYYGNSGAVDLDVHLQPVHSYVGLDGLSSRARVSPDGRYGSVTQFVSGDSYGAPFSTRDHIFDLTSGDDLGTLEEFTVYKDGAVFQSPSFNFWGTTFAHDGRTFYATLGDGSVGAPTYLVKGDLADRTLAVLTTGVECPALSPDETRIVFKKRIQEPSIWRLAVMDLSTLEVTMLNESRLVDDQAEWLDNDHVLYGMSRATTGTDLSTDIWVASTRGDEVPRMYLADAVSPAVVR